MNRRKALTLIVGVVAAPTAALAAQPPVKIPFSEWPELIYVDRGPGPDQSIKCVWHNGKIIWSGPIRHIDNLFEWMVVP